MSLAIRELETKSRDSISATTQLLSSRKQMPNAGTEAELRVGEKEDTVGGM